MTSQDPSGQKSLILELTLVGYIFSSKVQRLVGIRTIGPSHDSSQNMDDGGVSGETDNWCGKCG